MEIRFSLWFVVPTSDAYSDYLTQLELSNFCQFIVTEEMTVVSDAAPNDVSPDDFLCLLLSDLPAFWQHIKRNTAGRPPPIFLPSTLSFDAFTATDVCTSLQWTRCKSRRAVFSVFTMALDMSQSGHSPTISCVSQSGSMAVITPMKRNKLWYRARCSAQRIEVDFLARGAAEEALLDAPPGSVIIFVHTEPTEAPKGSSCGSSSSSGRRHSLYVSFRYRRPSVGTVSPKVGRKGSPRNAGVDGRDMVSALVYGSAGCCCCLTFICILIFIGLGFKKVESSQWALVYDWWAESVREDAITQAGLHFVGLGSYLLLFPATSKYCKMMWEEEAIQFWESVPGGSMSRAAAKSKWDNMKENIEVENLITDTEGPKQAPLRIRIHTGDVINFEGTYGRSKQLGCMWRVDAVSNQKKKATEAEVQKMARTLMVNHDSAPGSMDLHDAARGMVGSHDMEGLSSTLADVEALAPDSEGSEPEKDDAEQDEDEDVELKLKPKKAKWWDRDRHVNKAHKTLMTAYEKLYESASSQLSKCKEVEKEVSALPRKDKKIVEGDLAILQSRYACLQKLWETEEGLRDYIRDFDAPAPLKTFASYKAKLDDVLEATSTDEVEAAKNTVNDVYRASKSAESDLTKAVKAIRKAEQEAAAKTGPKKKAAAKGGGQGVFDRADKLATVPQNTEGENILNLALPCLVHSLDEKQRSFENTNVVKAQVLQEFVQLFSAQSTAQKLDRAHKRLPRRSIMQAGRCCAAHRQWLPGSEYGSEKALEGAGSLKQARDLLLDMDESKLEVLRSKGYEIYFAKGDALYMPPAWIFAERIVGSGHWVGVCAAVLCAPLAAQEDLKWLSRDWCREDETLNLMIKNAPKPGSPENRDEAQKKREEEEAKGREEQKKREEEEAQKRGAEEARRGGGPKARGAEKARRGGGPTIAHMSVQFPRPPA
eukprot:s444_g28.t1